MNSSAVFATARPRPVLMVPLRRCGSHALRLRLNSSPDFYSPYPLHIVDFMPMVPLYGDLADDRNYFQLVVDVIGLQAASMVKWDNMLFDPVAVFDAIQHEPRSVHRVVWELLFQAGARHGARVVMDKSLDSVHYARELFALFPDLLLLNVVRDPRAQVASMNRAIIHDFDSYLNAVTWLEAHGFARELAARYPDRILTIRYEDFLSSQESVLRSICRFFGIEFTHGMLDVSRSDDARKIAGLSALWESNASAPIPANADKFRKSLSQDEIELIETVTGEMMDYYGYERMTRGQSVFGPDFIRLARERSEAGRRQAWADLASGNYRDYTLRQFRADYLRSVRERLLRARPERPHLAVQQPEAQGEACRAQH